MRLVAALLDSTGLDRALGTWDFKVPCPGPAQAVSQVYSPTGRLQLVCVGLGVQVGKCALL